MKILITFAAAAAATAAFATPALAQTAYPYPGQAYPQQSYPGYAQPGYAQPGYPGYAQPGYAQPGYPQPGYAQPYGNGNVVSQVIDSLLGNRYNRNDRTAVSQCAAAAVAQAQGRYAGYGQQPYGAQGYGQRYNPALRVTAITAVERRNNGLRVRGLIDSGMSGYGGYGQPGYGAPAYGNSRYAQGDLSFRCNVDYRGAVTNVRIDRNSAYRR